MLAKQYNIKKGSLHEQFWNLRTPIQIFGGGFGNGKTTALVVKGLIVARDYPGCKILVCRETEKKVKSTIMLDWFKWMPAHWIKSFNKDDGDLVLKNGTIVHFRYLAQRGDGFGNSTSNVLSGSYDLIIVDQIEDPGIVQKDFDDLLGRRRGMTPYRGNDPTMPRDGCRWVLLNCNPTSNWVYRSLVRPYHMWKANKPCDGLMLDPETGQPMLEVVEGSTYENQHNLPKDYIKVMEARYTGQMKDRFLMGKWANYEGLVYPQYNPEVHLIRHEEVMSMLDELRGLTREIQWVEGYDHGMAKPACYMLGFVHPGGSIVFVDGFYEAELTLGEITGRINLIRTRYGVPGGHTVWADPSLFRRTPSENNRVVGHTVAELFWKNGVGNLVPGNNEIINGVTKVQTYLEVQSWNTNPFTGVQGAPLMYFSEKLGFVDTEASSYNWKRQESSGETVDKPNDRNDHAMDVIKYITGSRPEVTDIMRAKTEVPAYMVWSSHQSEKYNDPRQYRHR